jgi:hypothetical protein
MATLRGSTRTVRLTFKRGSAAITVPPGQTKMRLATGSEVPLLVAVRTRFLPGARIIHTGPLPSTIIATRPMRTLRTLPMGHTLTITLRATSARPRGKMFFARPRSERFFAPLRHDVA